MQPTDIASTTDSWLPSTMLEDITKPNLFVRVLGSLQKGMNSTKLFKLDKSFSNFFLQSWSSEDKIVGQWFPINFSSHFSDVVSKSILRICYRYALGP